MILLVFVFTAALAFVGYELTVVSEKIFQKKNWDWVHKREMRLVKRQKG